MATLPKTYLTEQEYLALDRASEGKSEYFDGQMVAMSGSLPHARIGGNLLRAFGAALRSGPCEPFNNDLRLYIAGCKSYFYPDMMVFSGEPRLVPGADDMVDNPVLVAEVLSPSTESYDRGAKFVRYRAIDSLRDYMLVSQAEPFVELYSRGADGRWVLSDAIGLDAVLRIDNLGCSIPLAGIYDRVAFPEA